MNPSYITCAGTTAGNFCALPCRVRLAKPSAVSVNLLLNEEVETA